VHEMWAFCGPFILVSTGFHSTGRSMTSCWTGELVIQLRKVDAAVGVRSTEKESGSDNRFYHRLLFQVSTGSGEDVVLHRREAGDGRAIYGIEVSLLCSLHLA
jgi:hypothetical protein